MHGFFFFLRNFGQDDATTINWCLIIVKYWKANLEHFG